MFGVEGRNWDGNKLKLTEIEKYITFRIGAFKNKVGCTALKSKAENYYLYILIDDYQ